MRRTVKAFAWVMGLDPVRYIAPNIKDTRVRKKVNVAVVTRDGRQYAVNIVLDKRFDRFSFKFSAMGKSEHRDDDKNHLFPKHWAFIHLNGSLHDRNNVRMRGHRQHRDNSYDLQHLIGLFWDSKLRRYLLTLQRPGLPPWFPQQTPARK